MKQYSKKRRAADTALAWHLKRHGMKLTDLARLTGESYATCRGWHSGRYRTPRTVMRLLAAWRLLHWRASKAHHHPSRD